MYVEFLRHGLPEGDDCLRGITDFALTETGFKQMQRSFGADSLTKDNTPDLIISSPLKRCKIFASWLADKEGIELVEDAHWQEMNFGIWDGMKLADIHEQYPQVPFWHDPHTHHIPEAEKFVEFMQRINNAWERLLDEHYDDGAKVLVVTHSGVIRQIMHYILQLSQESLTHIYQLNLPYAAKVGINVYRDETGKYWPQIQWPDLGKLE